MNARTRRASGRAVCDFLAWCVRSLAAVQPLPVAGYVAALSNMVVVIWLGLTLQRHAGRPQVT